MRARTLDGRLHAAGEPDVIVLDQNRVEEAGAMVRGAARRDRVLLERAQRRRRLARVEDRDAAGRGVDEQARACGDAREPLQEIERRAFADEQRPRARVDGGDRVARAARLAVAAVHGEPSAVWRNASNATSSPARMQSALAMKTPRAGRPGATVASVVTSPSRTSSSSARRTRSRYADGSSGFNVGQPFRGRQARLKASPYTCSA